MKKKIIILTIILVAIVLVGYTQIRSDKTTTEVSKEWTLSEEKLEKLSLIGAEQNVNAQIIQTNQEQTVVKLTGKVSEKTKKELNKAKVDGKQLDIILADLNGFKLMPSNEGKSELTFQIFLGKNVNIKNITIESIIGNIKVEMPNDFQGKYETEAKNGGKVLMIPETNKSEDKTIKISTMGDMQIKK